MDLWDSSGVILGLKKSSGSFFVNILAFLLKGEEGSSMGNLERGTLGCMSELIINKIIKISEHY